HYLDALLARGNDDLATAADQLREALLYDPESPHLHTVLADVRLKQGRVADAEEELKSALAADPEHAAAHLLVARIAQAREKSTLAETHLRAAIAAAPDDPEAYRELVRLELAVGNGPAALEAAQKLSARSIQAQAAARKGDDDEGSLTVTADRLRSQAAAAWTDVGRVFAQRHDAAGAQKAFDEARAASPSDWEALSAEGSFRESQRDFEGARLLYLRLLGQRPESPDVLAALARLALEEGDLDTVDAHAKKLLGMAAELEPGTAGNPEGEEDRRETVAALLRVAVSLLGAHRSAGAQAALDGALRLYPNHPELLFYRAMALSQRGRPHEGAVAFEQVARHTTAISPSFLGATPQALALDARVQAALARSKAGEQTEAIQRLRSLFTLKPTDEGVALALLEAYDRAGRPGDAADLLAAASKAHPGTEALLYALANAQDRMGQREKAVATMRKVLLIEADHAGALNYIGYTLAEQGNLAEAKELLGHAVELRPDDGAIADSYGYCLLQLGHAADALVELRRADRLTPGDPIILSHLGDALLAAGKKEQAAETFRHALTRLGPDGVKRERPLTAAEAALPADPPDRVPEPGDDKVRKELAQKLRALSTRP
ncbi:MAG TPA: tetratricopeptide repeat protein, partial [Myxococcales bacterium]|nr:tetratricopeptide repeat protein [Myxococcales bacterium]